MVVQTSAFIVGQNESRVLPRNAFHQGIDQRLDILRAQLDVDGVLIRIGTVFIEPCRRRGRDHGYLRQGSVLNIREVLRDWHQMLGIVLWNGMSPLKILNVTVSEQTLGGRVRSARSVLR